MCKRYYIFIAVFILVIIGCQRLDKQVVSIISPAETNTYTVSCYMVLGVPTMCAVTDESTKTIRIENIVKNVVNQIVKKELVTEVPVEKITTRVQTRYVEIEKEVDIEEIVIYIIERIKEYVDQSNIIDVPTEDVVDETTDYITDPMSPDDDNTSTTMGDMRDEMSMPTPTPDEKTDEMTDSDTKTDETDDGSNSRNNGNDPNNENNGNDPNNENNGNDPNNENNGNDPNNEITSNVRNENEGITEGVGQEKLLISIGPKAVTTRPSLIQPGLSVSVTCNVDGILIHPRLSSFTIFRNNNRKQWGVEVWCQVPDDLDDSDTTIHVDVHDTLRWCGLTSADVNVYKFVQASDSTLIGGEKVDAVIRLSPELIPLCNNLPVFSDGKSTIRYVLEGTPSNVAIGFPIPATDDDGDTLEYTLGGTDADSFSIDSNSGQIRTKDPIDYETKNSYSVLVSVSDDKEGKDEIDVTINVTDDNEAPIFTEGESATRSIAENTLANSPIGDPVSATDENNDTLEYALVGTDAGSFNIDNSSGQLKTSVSLNYEIKDTYSVSLIVSDNNGGTDEIAVTINVSDENDAPIFTDGTDTTRSVAENLSSGAVVGDPVLATDEDEDTLEYDLAGTDESSFDINSVTGQITTTEQFNYENKDSYAVLVTVTDNNGGTDEINVTISISDENDKPIFPDGFFANRAVAENLAIGALVGDPVAATDEDEDTLEYSLAGTDADSFSIDMHTGQITTNEIFNHEEESSYSVSVRVSDGRGGTNGTFLTVSITDVNDAPVFTEGENALRAIIESAASGANVGHAVSATDEDEDTLEYSLSGTDESSFSFNTMTGQLTTNSTLDYDDQASYTVTVSVTDNNGGTDTITVEIEVLEFYVEKEEFFEVYYATNLDSTDLEVQIYMIRGYGYDGENPIYVDNYYKFSDGSSEQTSTGWGSIEESDTIAYDLNTWKSDYPESFDYIHDNIKVSAHDNTPFEARKTIYEAICNAAKDLGEWEAFQVGLTYPETDNNTSDDVLTIDTMLLYLDDEDCDPYN